MTDLQTKVLQCGDYLEILRRYALDPLVNVVATSGNISDG